MKRYNKVKKILLLILVVVLVISGGFVLSIRSKLEDFSEEVSSIEVQEIDLSKINDGTYTGKYYVNETVGAIVEVTIKENNITDIIFIEHKYGKGKKAEVITGSVIEEQSLEVDTISGATGSSIVILKAIEDALISSY
ncbi:FMN-binding protein [Clostridium sp. D2Q-11]|uniref:FMN-binding protein n=1 Tax=Anaeromonas frigoriresistens TaxID=2683708 RepID=A0A942UYU0_9FIRM|nr:FMN-binding protein [Anaeromonas frigoriresistens]MBS4539501.1 FMN-binding protein [Anaeromonas frigoriresistens]